MRPVDIMFPKAERGKSILKNVCVKPPFGCGKKVRLPWKDETSEKEYKISGLCQDCQNIVFGS